MVGRREPRVEFQHVLVRERVHAAIRDALQGTSHADTEKQVAAVSWARPSVGCAIHPHILLLAAALYVVYGALFVRLFVRQREA